MNFYLIGAVIIIAIVIIFYHKNTTLVRAESRDWRVISDFKNKQDAAELLARTNARMIEFMRYLKTKYHIDEPTDTIEQEGEEHALIVSAPGDIYNVVDNLLNNYNPETFLENDPRTSNDTSYTVNKGASMYICLRDKKNPASLVDENVLTFVILHEMSHEANYGDWGHSTKFWRIFKFILNEAVLAGIYKPVDYEKYPVNYCGLEINYSPLYDSGLKNIWEVSTLK